MLSHLSPSRESLKGRALVLTWVSLTLSSRPGRCPLGRGLAPSRFYGDLGLLAALLRRLLPSSARGSFLCFWQGLLWPSSPLDADSQTCTSARASPWGSSLRCPASTSVTAQPHVQDGRRDPPVPAPRAHSCLPSHVTYVARCAASRQATQTEASCLSSLVTTRCQASLTNSPRSCPPSATGFGASDNRPLGTSCSARRPHGPLGPSSVTPLTPRHKRSLPRARVTASSTFIPTERSTLYIQPRQEGK